MQVRVHPVAREVVAVYKVDDAEAELSIQLPTNHPLGLVKVECVKNLAGQSHRSNWMRQITIFLNYQNISVYFLRMVPYGMDSHSGRRTLIKSLKVLKNVTFAIPYFTILTTKFHDFCAKLARRNFTLSVCINGLAQATTQHALSAEIFGNTDS
ncbi:hypothetical protein J437_LFUL000079 [Ladona fulva]|uniref:E3 ubiquitin-protein ligase listerin n=1 Tax=Ladona fulva TaxID=123851 RepID=A0A8K0P1W8_LADFU|nr:hypothetical protein J437_LFUL000079 [Ladona fulva]